MLLRVALLAVICSCYGFPAEPQQQQQQQQQQPSKPAEPKQVFYLPEQQQQYTPPLQYDLSLLEPQFQFPQYNFVGDKQHFPRVQPQILLYHGGAAPGQPFLLQPGSPPPGNFLVPQPQPQPGPNVIFRDAPARPPVFVAGYPKPAHIPPIEKDAEEIPTNPAKIPPLGSPKAAGKPEKVETFNEGDENTKKPATEAEVLAAADRNPAFNTPTNLRPGQRFFILNGQPLFSYENQIYPSPGLNKYNQFAPTFLPQQPTKNISPYQNVLLRNGQFDELAPSHRLGETPLNPYPENLILLNQPFQNDLLFKSNLQVNQAQNNKEAKPELRFNDGGSFGLYQLQGDQDNDAVIIDARQQDQSGTNAETDSEVVSAPEKTGEPTISQAQPGAIALAGPGGVAAAAPRGNAFVGKEGLAISSPQATAIAGPTRDEIQQNKNRKQSNKKKQ